MQCDLNWGSSNWPDDWLPLCNESETSEMQKYRSLRSSVKCKGLLMDAIKKSFFFMAWREINCETFTTERHARILWFQVCNLQPALTLSIGFYSRKPENLPALRLSWLISVVSAFKTNSRDKVTGQSPLRVHWVIQGETRRSNMNINCENRNQMQSNSHRETQWRKPDKHVQDAETGGRDHIASQGYKKIFRDFLRLQCSLRSS